MGERPQAKRAYPATAEQRVQPAAGPLIRIAGIATEKVIGAAVITAERGLSPLAGRAGYHSSS
jgi:hypothetical protein